MGIMEAPVNAEIQKRFEFEYAVPNGYEITKYIDGSYMFMETSDAYDRWFRNEIAKNQ